MPTFAKNPTPEYQQARDAILQRRGKDPSKFDIDLETGKIIELPSSLESAGVGAAYNVPDAAVGGAGLAVAQRVLAGIPATSIPGVIAKVGGTLAAPFIANMLANKAGMQEGKQALMPSLAEKYEISAQANPLSTELGGIASGVAGGMKPSISNIGRAGSAIRGLAAGVPFKRLPVAQSGALVNVGAGAALGGGIPAAQSAVAGDFDLAKTLIGAGGGAFLSEPNKLGRAMGFKPTPSVDTSMQLPADRSRLAPTASEQMPQPYRDLMARTADLQDTQMSFTDKVTDETGAEVRGKFTPSVKPLEQSLIAVSERAGLHDTPPHEILHGILLDLQASGNPNERALAQRALAAAGGEESLVQAAGEEMSTRMTPGGREGIISDLTSLVRDRFLRRGTKGDYARILANIMQRQGARSERTGLNVVPPKSPESEKPADAPEQKKYPAPDVGTAKRIIASFKAGKIKNVQKIADELPEPVDWWSKDWQHQTSVLRQLMSYGEGDADFTRSITVRGKPLWQYLNEVQAAEASAPSSGKPAENLPTPEYSTLDTGEQTYSETGFEGYKPPSPPMRIPKQPTEDAYWETAGGEYPQPEPSPLGPEIQRPPPTGATSEPIGRNTALEAAQRQPTPMEPGREEAVRGYAEDAQVRYQRIKDPQTETPEFKRWFGGSKVVDKSGVPLKLYHGTSEDFNKFNTDINPQDLGTHLTADASITPGDRTVPLYAKIENPLRLTDPGDWESDNIANQLERLGIGSPERILIEAGLDPSKDVLTNQHIKQFLKNRGYDGIVYLNRWEVNTKNKTPFTSWAQEGTSKNPGDQRFKLMSPTSTDSFIVFEPTQIKSATGNRGTFDPTNPDIRYQRFGPTKDQVSDVPSRGLNPFEGEASKLERVGPHHASLASAFRSVNDARRSFNGRYANPMIEAFERLPNESRARLYETLVDESRGGKPLRAQLTTAEERTAYDTIRTVIRQMAQDQIAAGQPVWTKKGSRPRGMNPMYFPNVMAGEIRRILAEAPGTQAFSDLRREFITHQMANKISQAEAEQRFEDLLGDFANNPASNPAKFGGVRMPEGVGLPDSWIEKDPIKAIRSYSNRFSRDRAFWDVIETKPELMQMLGSSKYGDQQPIPATLSGPNLIRDPQVQNLLRDFFGTAQVGTEPVFKGAARLATGALVGPGSKIADVSTVPFKSLAYAPSTSSGINAVLRGLADWRGGYERAFETGLNRRGGLVVATDLLGFGERVNQTLMTVTEALTKYTGAEQLELASRGLSQSIGEYIGDSWQILARNNDPKAIEFLAKLQADATTPRAELGTRIAQLLQGRYDATNLPAMALSGPISPFFALQRWSVEQLNNFQRFAIQPALQGDFRPAIAQILAGLTGGLVINEIREAVSGKKSQTATWKELEAGKGKPGYADAVAYKLINAAQITGTIGIVTEITKQLYEAGTKRQVQGLNFPLISVGADAISRVMAGAAAISEGQDAMEVTKAVANDILKNNIQAYRLARNALGRTGLNEQAARDLERNNENRDLQVWSQMEGRPTGVPTQTQPSYSRLSEKEFDQATPREAVSMAPELFKEAVRSSNNNPSVLAQRLRQMKSIKVEGMPNPETNPTDAVKYFNWIKQTQGPEEASRLWKEFQKRQAEAKFKRQLIPSFSSR